jgi:hypothetical protein
MYCSAPFLLIEPLAGALAIALWIGVYRLQPSGSYSSGAMTKALMCKLATYGLAFANSGVYPKSALTLNANLF